jgi:hypothetical protein
VNEIYQEPESSERSGNLVMLVIPGKSEEEEGKIILLG